MVSSERERFDGSPCRDITERRAGLRHAQGAVDQALARECADHVLADVIAGEARRAPSGVVPARESQLIWVCLTFRAP